MEYYVVTVNLGSADHSVYKIAKEDGMWVPVDDSVDACFDNKEVRQGVLDRGGVVYFFAETLEQAEDVQTGIWMVRRMLKDWLDS